MADQSQIREVAKHLAGQKSEVRDRGSYGFLNGSLVEKSHGCAIIHGDSVKVIDNMIFVNGSYRETLRR